MRRQGLTMMQLAIVIMVAAVVIGIVIPIVHELRMAAARTETNNNLKQCALAVHEFHDKWRRLPDGFRAGGNYEDQAVSLWFHLLPYLKAQDVYDAGTVDAVVPAFLAPSDPYRGNPAGVVNFAGNVRVFAYDTLTPAKANEVHRALDVPAGVLKSGMTLPRIVDGTSNVIMLTTRYADCAGQTTWYAADMVGATQLAPLPRRGVGGFTGAGSYTTPPTRKNEPLSAMFQLAPRRDDCIPQDAFFGHSFGSGGMSIALCDASVKNISPMMTPTRFAEAMSPGDSGGRISSDWEQD
jgi:hypothetical protein